MKNNGHQNGHNGHNGSNGHNGRNVARPLALTSSPKTATAPIAPKGAGASLLRYRGAAAMTFQAAMIFISLILAWLLRFDFHFPDKSLLFSIAPLLIAVRLLSVRVFNLHHGWWRYTGVMDALDVLKSVVCGSVVFWATMQFFSNAELRLVPNSIYVLEAIITTGMLTGARLFSRALSDSMHEDFKSGMRVLLIGAGAASRIFVKEMTSPVHGYSVVGLVDDDASKKGLRIHGVPVLGSVDRLPELVKDLAIEEVFIVVPSASPEQMQRFIAICNEASIRFRTVPGLSEIVSGESSLQQLREVRLEDLLGRMPADIDLEAVRKEITDRRVLVTGAAGSIGSELCKQILKYDPAALVCVDQNENGLYHLQTDIIPKAGSAELSFHVADITDDKRIDFLLAESAPSLIFHAAAYKHVPMMENNVQEAVRNNVFGFMTVLQAAERVGCEKFVLISSDKAVNPVSIMGATKRICELIMASKPRSAMACTSVRFGNVLGSAGSVVPLLQKQLREKKTLTITDPAVKRFFMVINEAVGLVLQASVVGGHGDILVLEMGQQLLVLDLAKDLIRLSGRPVSEVDIEFTGLRDGEKIEEELFYLTEKVVPTSCASIVRAQGSIMPWAQLRMRLEALRSAISDGDPSTIRKRVQQIVPEYSYVSTERKHYATRMVGGFHD